MKWKPSYFWITAAIFLLPLIVYFLEFVIVDLPLISTNSQDWTAFGGMYYGLVIAGLTGINIWIINKKETENIELQKDWNERNEELKRTEYLISNLREFRSLEKDFLDLIQNLNYERGKELKGKIKSYKEERLFLFENLDIRQKFEEWEDATRQYSQMLHVYVKPNLKEGYGLYDYLTAGVIKRDVYTTIKKLMYDSSAYYNSVTEAMKMEILENYFHAP